MCCEPVLEQASPPLQPRPGARRTHVELDPVPASVSLARAFVRDVLTDADPDARETALLLASELVTNAILHARTSVGLGVVVDEQVALVCVADRVADTAVLTPQAQSRTRPGGRGLALVSDLSQQWGTTVYSGGKSVWFSLPVAAQALKVG